MKKIMLTVIVLMGISQGSYAGDGWAITQRVLKTFAESDEIRSKVGHLALQQITNMGGGRTTRPDDSTYEIKVSRPDMGIEAKCVLVSLTDGELTHVGELEACE